MPNISTGSGIRITGTADVLTKLGNIRREPQKAMRRAASARASKTVMEFQRQMNAEYKSAWATGQIARGIKGRVKNEKDGVSISFGAPMGAREHLQYITAAVPGGFSRFPVAPYVMTAEPGRSLRIRFPGRARAFIQDPATGRLSGAKEGGIVRKSVLWGSNSGGFKRDVIVEVSQSEGAIFVAEMMAAVAASIGKTTK